MRDKAGMKFDCIFEEPLDFIDINYTHLNMIVRYERRQHGEWKYNQYDGNLNIGNWHCSECRHIVFGGYNQKPYFNFCPNCGASMMKEGDEK